jgi:hypothetical protein
MCYAPVFLVSSFGIKAYAFAAILITITQGDIMKTIKYIKKITSANTEYRHVSNEDRTWVLEQCSDISAMVANCIKSGESRLIQTADILMKPLDEMPRQGRGPYRGSRNSVKSFCEGVIDNFADTQYDFSEKTMKGLSVAFKVASEEFTTFEDVEFVEAVSVYEALKNATISKEITPSEALFEWVMVEPPKYEKRVRKG